MGGMSSGNPPQSQDLQSRSRVLWLGPDLVHRVPDCAAKSSVRLQITSKMALDQCDVDHGRQGTFLCSPSRGSRWVLGHKGSISTVGHLQVNTCGMAPFWREGGTLGTFPPPRARECWFLPRL